jgi:hypothetical protein
MKRDEFRCLMAFGFYAQDDAVIDDTLLKTTKESK